MIIGDRPGSETAIRGPLRQRPRRAESQRRPFTVTHSGPDTTPRPPACSAPCCNPDALPAKGQRTSGFHGPLLACPFPWTIPFLPPQPHRLWILRGSLPGSLRSLCSFSLELLSALLGPAGPQTPFPVPPPRATGLHIRCLPQASVYWNDAAARSKLFILTSTLPTPCPDFPPSVNDIRSLLGTEPQACDLTSASSFTDCLCRNWRPRFPLPTTGTEASPSFCGTAPLPSLTPAFPTSSYFCALPPCCSLTRPSLASKASMWNHCLAGPFQPDPSLPHSCPLSWPQAPCPLPPQNLAQPILPPSFSLHLSVSLETQLKSLLCTLFVKPCFFAVHFPLLNRYSTFPKDSWCNL